MVRNYIRKTRTPSWSRDDLIQALLTIKNEKVSVTEASRQSGISRATLYRHYSRFLRDGGNPDLFHMRSGGGSPILTRLEEDVFVKTLLDLQSGGGAIAPYHVKQICYEYCDHNGLPNKFDPRKRMASDDWYYGFLKRHPNLEIVGTKSKQGSQKSSGGQTPKKKANGVIGDGRTISDISSQISLSALQHKRVVSGNGPRNGFGTDTGTKFEPNVMAIKYEPIEVMEVTSTSVDEESSEDTSSEEGGEEETMEGDGTDNEETDVDESAEESGEEDEATNTNGTTGTEDMDIDNGQEGDGDSDEETGEDEQEEEENQDEGILVESTDEESTEEESSDSDSDEKVEVSKDNKTRRK